MMMLVSSRSLPLAGIYPLAVLFYSSSHFLRRHSIEEACELAQSGATFARRGLSGQGRYKPKHLGLHFRW
jgi:hypothetical protein